MDEFASSSRSGVFSTNIGNALVTGANSLLGPYLLSSIGSKAETYGLSRSGPGLQVDLRDASEVKPVLAERPWDLVIHAAAMTDVDGCENDPVEAGRAPPPRTLDLRLNVAKVEATLERAKPTMIEEITKP